MAKPKSDDRDVFDKALDDPYVRAGLGAAVGYVGGRALRGRVRKPPMSKAAERAGSARIRQAYYDGTTQTPEILALNRRLLKFDEHGVRQLTSGLKGAAAGGFVGAVSAPDKKRRKK